MQIKHLFEVPQHTGAVAALIHNEFWTAVPGASVHSMTTRLQQAQQPDAVPLCLVALSDDGQPVGAGNLVNTDEENRPHWSPWLAGMVVAQPMRGQGIGTALVQALLLEARRMGLQHLYLGSDGPGFYTRLGAQVIEQPQANFWFLRFDLGLG